MRRLLQVLRDHALFERLLTGFVFLVVGSAMIWIVIYLILIITFGLGYAYP